MLWLLFGLRLGHADEPLIPLNLFANRVFRYGVAAGSFTMGVFIGMAIYTPVYLELVVGLSASDSGLALIPLMVGTVVGATTSGQVMRRVKHYKIAPIVGLSISATAVATLGFIAGKISLIWLELLFICISAGLGTVLPVATVSVQNAVSKHQMGVATGSINFFRSLGGAVVVAVFGAILLGGGVAAGLHGTVGAANVPTDVVVSAFRMMFFSAASLLVVSLVMILRMDELPLRSANS